jgi:hypothetical protein
VQIGSTTLDRPNQPKAVRWMITLWVGRAQLLGGHSPLLIRTNRQAQFGTIEFAESGLSRF